MTQQSWMRLVILITLAGLVSLAVSGCAPSERVVPTPERATATPTASPTILVPTPERAIATPTATPTILVPTATSLPSPTPTTTPLAPGVSIEVSYEGPVGQLALIRDDGLWLVVSGPGGPGQERLVEGGDISSPRFSPDGRWLLFRQEGQPWIVPITGGEAMPMEADVSHCVWSPVGSRLACATEDGGLVLHDPATRTSQRVLPTGSGVGEVAWSPDGGWLAYEKWEPLPGQGLPTYQGLWRVRVDGTQAGEVFANADPVARQSLLAGWSPDGNHILFWQGLELSASLAADGLPLLSVPVGGGEPARLADAVLVHDDFVVPASEGDRLLLIEGSGRELWLNKALRLAAAGGSEARTLVAPGEAGPLSMAWSPDGRQIAYAAGPAVMPSEAYDRREEALAGRRIWLMNADGSGKQQLTDDPAYADERPIWSAEGKYLVFVRRPVAGGPAGVWAYNLHTHQPPHPMAGDLPIPGEYHGHFRWDTVLDWRAGPVAPPSPATATPTPEPSLTLTVVYDNNAYDPRLKAAWGFACLIERGETTILFDTGGDGAVLLSNMAVLDLDPRDVDVVVLSHIHGDHTGGLGGLLATGAQPTVYVPRSFPADFKAQVKAHARVVEVREPMEILPGVYTTGEMGSGIIEQALVLSTARGLVVVTGCAHPGVVEMVRRAKEVGGGDALARGPTKEIAGKTWERVSASEVYLVLGGFHLGGASEARIEEIIADFRQLGVQRVAPCHCTGDKAFRLFREAYGEDFIEAGVGLVLNIGP